MWENNNFINKNYSPILKLKELKTQVKTLQLRHLLTLIKEMIESIYLNIMDSHNLFYLIDTLLEFESSLFEYAEGDYSIYIETLFYILKESINILFKADLLLKTLKK